jgi:uncharacterized OB-fold protein
MTNTDAANDWPQPYRLLDAQPYWDAASAERLTFQRCPACEAAVWPANSCCPHCGAGSLRWEESRGHGTIYSYSTIVRGPTPVFSAIAPYTVGFVHLDEGYFLFAQIDAEPETIEIGQEVAVGFVQRGAQKLPTFTLVNHGPEV